MSVINVSNRWLNRTYKVLAILLVLVAVVISAFRLSLPYVGHYKESFQNYINDSNQTNITIGELGMSWQRWGPAIIAEQVTLVDDDNAHIYIEHLEIQIDFWASLTRQKLVSSNLTLDGAQFKVSETAWNLSASVDKSATKSKSDNKLDSKALTDFEQISTIFLNRLNSFSLKNTHIIVYNDVLARNFHINNLHWTNRGTRHQAQGTITFDELSSNNLSLKIDINGDSFDELTGLMYLEANHLDITPWLDSVLALDNDKTKTDIGFSTWLGVSQGNINRLQVVLHDNHLSWEDKRGQHSLSLSTGQLLLVKEPSLPNFKLFSTPLLVQYNQQDELEYIVQMNKTEEGVSVYLSAFDLALISQVSPLFISEKNTRELLSQLSLSGKADDIYFKKSTKNTEVLASFADASTLYSKGIPGIDNLSGTLSFTDNYLNLDLSAKQGALDFKELFVSPIVYQSFTTNVGVDFDAPNMGESAWQLQANNIDLVSPELVMNGDMKLSANADEGITMSLLASIIQGDASKAGHYFPLTKMSTNLVSYLNNAIVSGNLTQAQILVNGPLSHFPFTDHSGVFVVDAELDQAVFNFANNWPNITGFSANLNFTNNSMLITGRAGSLVGLDVDGVQAAIDDLAHAQILNVDTLIKPSSAGFIADLIQQSPLKDNVGAVLTQLQISGDIEGEFHLNLPLKSTDQALATGIINFSDNRMALQKPRMDFAKINGQLSFANEKIATKNLSLTWLDMPLTLAVSGVNKAEYYDTDIAITADWSEHVWQPHVTPVLKKYLSGQAQWQGALSLYQHHNGGFSYDFNIASDLAQTHLYLPTPYKKVVGVKEPFTVKVSGGIKQSTINVNYGEQLSFFGELEHENTHFNRAHLVLGDEKMLLPMDGFHITTKLAQADFDDWQPLIDDIVATTSGTDQANQDETLIDNSAPLFSKPERIRGTLAHVDILGQELNNVSFNLLDKKNWWLLQLNAKETRSRIKFYPDWLNQGIDVNADFMHFSSNKVSKDTALAAEVEPAVKKTINAEDAQDIFNHIPKINLHCDRCQVDKLDFGEVNFLLSRTSEDVIKIEHFSAKREQAEFNLAGQWQKNSQRSITDLQGNLMLKDIEYELEQLGYGSIIRDSGGKLNFDLNWQGGPHEFSVAYLNGEIHTVVDDGYLSEVSDKARIFSVLSLESIVRKLTLDFRDIFSDGMFYSDIKGDYHFKNGVLYTDNTRMNGTAGNLYLKGNTDLISNTLDYTMSYKPNLTSSLPVLAWIATLDPVIFLAGLAIDQVITSQVVSELNFELTGTVNEPQFKEVNRKSRNISVGRATPPEFVDNTPRNDPSKNQNEKDSEKKTKSLKQYKEIKYPDDLPKELNNG